MEENPSLRERIFKFGSRLARTRMKASTVSQVRLLILIGAVLTLYLAFKYTQEWDVEYYADYNWARDLGF